MYATKQEIYRVFFTLLKVFAENIYKKYVPQEMTNGLSLRQ